MASPCPTSGCCARSPRCPTRPNDFVDLVRVLAIDHTPAAAEAVVMSLLLFREWPQAPAGWSTQFMLDSEWNWLGGEPPIDDL